MRLLPILLFIACHVPVSAFAVSTPITYQGSLQEGGLPANGAYDFAFQLKTSGGNNIGSPILLEDVAVLGGVFSVQLDFGISPFWGEDRRLGISVRSGASVAPHTVLAPDALLTAAPYALYANNANYAESAYIADDVIDYAINNGDVASSAIDARTIANGAVTTDKLASNSVTLAKVLGANYTSPANLNATIAANDCTSYDIPVAGGFEPGDAVVLNTLTVLPDDVFIHVQGIISTNVVRMKFCNLGTTSQTVVNAQIRMISFR